MSGGEGGASVHKRLVFASAGCMVVIVLAGVVGVVIMKRLGFEAPPPQPVVPPVAAVAALDSLARFDFSAWQDPPDVRQLACRETVAMLHVAPWKANGAADVPLSFGDTFAAGSVQRDIWDRVGRMVVIERGQPVVGGVDPDALPPGRILMAGLRFRLERGESEGVCVVLAALVEKIQRLESRQSLKDLIGGAWLARDAVDMVGRESRVRAGTSLEPVQARRQLGGLDSSLRALRALQRLIEAAGAAPANSDSLAVWAQDSSFPLPVRDAFVRAIGYGWVSNPSETTLGIDRRRRVAIDSLKGERLPRSLAATAAGARDAVDWGVAQRVRFLSNSQSERASPP